MTIQYSGVSGVSAFTAFTAFTALLVPLVPFDALVAAFICGECCCCCCCRRRRCRCRWVEHSFDCRRNSTGKTPSFHSCLSNVPYSCSVVMDAGSTGDANARPPWANTDNMVVLHVDARPSTTIPFRRAEVAWISVIFSSIVALGTTLNAAHVLVTRSTQAPSPSWTPPPPPRLPRLGNDSPTNTSFKMC